MANANEVDSVASIQPVDVRGAVAACGSAIFMPLVRVLEGRPLRRAIDAFITISACEAALDIRDAHRGELARQHDEQDDDDFVAALVGSAITGAAICRDAIECADERDMLAASAARLADEIVLAAALTTRPTHVRADVETLLAGPA